jgi:hypothetical protein
MDMRLIFVSTIPLCHAVVNTNEYDHDGPSTICICTYVRYEKENPNWLKSYLW